MTLEALQEAIKRLINSRSAAYGNQAEQDRINTKLNKLYDLKFIMLQQLNERV